MGNETPIGEMTNAYRIIIRIPEVTFRVFAVVLINCLSYFGFLHFVVVEGSAVSEDVRFSSSE